MRAPQKGSLNHNYKHGGKGTRLYNIWKDMKKRCVNAKHISYKWYGAKGIKVCDEWSVDFVSFRDWSLAHGYNDTLTIDRKDSMKDYSPENCRWVSMQVQNNNTSKNVYLTINGQKLSLSQASRKYAIHLSTLIHRLERGWSVEKSISVKPKRGVNQYG